MAKYPVTNTTAERIPYSVEQSNIHSVQDGEDAQEMLRTQSKMQHSKEETNADYKRSIIIAGEKKFHITNITTDCYHIQPMQEAH